MYTPIIIASIIVLVILLVIYLLWPKESFKPYASILTHDIYLSTPSHDAHLSKEEIPFFKSNRNYVEHYAVDPYLGSEMELVHGDTNI